MKNAKKKEITTYFKYILVPHTHVKNCPGNWGVHWAIVRVSQERALLHESERSGLEVEKQPV